MKVNNGNLIKTKNDEVFPSTVVSMFNALRNKYGYTIRISMILQIIKEVFLGNIIDDFLLIDTRTVNNCVIESYLIDRYIDWGKGKEVNFSEIYTELCKAYPFSGKEKLLLEEINIEEKLWAFFLALSRSEL